MLDGTLVGAGAADILRYVGGHRYCDQGTDREQENSRTAADADVPQEAGCRLWRQRSVLRWQERDAI